MRTPINFRTLAILGAFGSAVSAHAFYFSINGTCDSSGVITSTSSELSSLPEFGSNFSYYLVLYTSGGFIADFSNGASTLDLSGPGSVSFADNVYSFSGTFTASSATSTSVEVGAIGTYSSTFDLADNVFTFTAGGSNPVPEPVSLATFGLGFVTLLARKRKA